MKRNLMCDLNFINLYSFYYNDWEYFEWFRNRNEGNFIKVLRWKGLNRVSTRMQITYENVWQDGIFNEDFVSTLSLVSRAFLFHLDDPIEYPIIDKYVWWAIKGLDAEDMRNKYPYHWDSDYTEDYVAFYDQIFNAMQDNIHAPEIEGVATEIVQRRMLDRALWEYGRTQNNLENNQ